MLGKLGRKKGNMGQAKQRKLAGLKPRETKPWHFCLEDVQEYLADHDSRCTSPNCSKNSIVLNVSDKDLYPEIRSGHPTELFIVNLQGQTRFVFHVKPTDLDEFFQDNGLLREHLCQNPNCQKKHTDEPIHLTFICHSAGVKICLERDGTVSFACGECNNRLATSKRTFLLHPIHRMQGPNNTIFCKRDGFRPMYLVCRHLLDGARAVPSLTMKSTKEDGGEAFCSLECSMKAHGEESDEDNQFAVICDLCAEKIVNK